MAASDTDHYPGGPDDQKVRVHSGTTGAKMASEAASHMQSHQRGPASSGDMTNNNHFTTTTTTISPLTPIHDDQRHLINHDDYSGLQVVDPAAVVLPGGLEVSQSQLPEPLAASDPETLHTPVSLPYSKASSATYAGGRNPFESDDQRLRQQQLLGGRKKTRICGLPRVVFWCVLAVVVFVIVAGVAVGVGVGLGTKDDSSR
ncbi:hypothetical protein DHEL01_v202029 [Diaporthe helianthi]|uniref:Uncharacterized protein n=1 Tax=Diaporthe helianthi TaxID=158607 RepID=A0A2P5IAR3_DIAHE|nr:hypothetical protein DHEL01_v202029 [Diaporthe helianthi]